MKKHFKKYFFIVLFLNANSFFAQDSIKINTLFETGMGFDESANDSINWYANEILLLSSNTSYERGKMQAYRLKAIYYQAAGKIDTSSNWIIQMLSIAEKLNDKEWIIKAKSDMASNYKLLKQHQNAIALYKEIIKIAEQINNPKQNSIACNSLGVMYRNENKYDSALMYYNKSLVLKQQINDEKGIANLNNNIGSLLIFQAKFAEAATYFKSTYDYHKKNNDRKNLWYDFINLSGVYTGTNRFADAKSMIDSAMSLSNELGSKEKIAETYNAYSLFYKETGDYKMAYEYYEKYYYAEAAINDENSRITVTEMQTKYETDKKDKENKLLSLDVEKQKLQKRNLIIISSAIALTGLLLAIAWRQNKRKNNLLQEKNSLIEKQNNKLTELNTEKNNLISIVSHDLAEPFASIKMWGQVLKADNDNLSDDGKKAVDRILTSTTNGETLIRNILDVEKAETNQHQLLIETFDIVNLTKQVVESFKDKALQKSIKISEVYGKQIIEITSDKVLIQRIQANLLSNAIKFTQPGKNIFITVSCDVENIYYKIKDEGVGIADEEQVLLFQKYKAISSQATAGEASTGLGLSIVKRIVDELNGKITVTSQLGAGTEFVVELKK